MTFRPIAALAAAAGLTACAGAPTANSGLLSAYDGLAPRTDVVRATIQQRRDDALAAAVVGVILRPAVLAPGVGAELTDMERTLVLREVDRQVCYEISKRFAVWPEAEAEGRAPIVRTVVSGIRPTGRAASAASAAAGQFIPGPIGLRLPGTLGGLSAEAELLTVDGAQAAAILWSRHAQAVGTDNPSLSRVGDAVQLAEPFGDAVAQAFAPPDRPDVAVPDPDPCAAYGPRLRPGGIAARFVTGLYSPELSGAAAAEEEEADGGDDER